MQHVKGRNTTKKDLCIFQNPFFFIGKAEDHPKQPSLSTLWSRSLEQSQSAYFLHNQPKADTF